MSSKRMSVHVEVAIALSIFDIIAVDGGATTYTVTTYPDAESYEGCDGGESADVEREDFLAMLQVARLAAELKNARASKASTKEEAACG